MIIRIDPDLDRPIYRQVAEEIKALIAAGNLREGQSLPSVRQVAADLGVNLNTVATAYRELQDEGLVALRHGARATVTSRTTRDPAEGDLRRSVRTALTGLVLAGLPRAEIMSLVADELRQLLKGAR